jgi:hypothetical protein
MEMFAKSMKRFNLHTPETNVQVRSFLIENPALDEHTEPDFFPYYSNPPLIKPVSPKDTSPIRPDFRYSEIVKYN